MGNKIQFRRGTNTQRLTVTPDEGEPIWTNDSQAFWIGNGSTIGGIAISGDFYNDSNISSRLNNNILNLSSHIYNVSTDIYTNMSSKIENISAGECNTSNLSSRVSNLSSKVLINIQKLSNTSSRLYNHIVNVSSDIYINMSSRLNNISSGATTWLQLTDTPSVFTGHAGKYVKTNISENALEFESPAFKVHKLTLLNQRSTKAFTLSASPSNSYYNFSNTIPSNTIFVFLEMDFTGTTDLWLKEYNVSSTVNRWEGSRGVSCISINSASFTKSRSGFVGVRNKQAFFSNGGSNTGVDVYVTGYITEETKGKGMYTVPLMEEKQILTNGTATTFTKINLTNLLGDWNTFAHDDTFNIIGVYVAFDSAVAQDVYFRAVNSSDIGVLHKINATYPHETTFVPVDVDTADYDFKFEYKTSAGNNLNIWLEAIILESPGYVSDHIISLPVNRVMSLGTNNSTWYDALPQPSCLLSYIIRDAKIVCPLITISPGRMNITKYRPKNGSNSQIYTYNNGCGTCSLWVPIGNNQMYEYYSEGEGSNNLDLWSPSYIIV